MAVKFNKDIKFGVATASTQIEGGDTGNTWYRWTKDHTATKDHTDCFVANSHWEKYKEHIDLMADLKMEIYRMSLEWSRIEPQEGVFNQDAIKHYRDEISYLHKKGIKVLVTLHHFSNPIWFEDKGGFINRKYCRERFSIYVRYVVENLQDLVDEWCTLNEVNIFTTSQYLFGEWFEGKTGFFLTMKVMRNMCLCHVDAYKLIHEMQKNANVGFALNINTFVPARKNNLIDRFVSWFLDRGFNICPAYAMAYGRFRFPLGFRFKRGEYLDFFGINYYTTREARGFNNDFIPNTPRNDLDWTISPDNFRKEIIRFRKLFGKDIYITENGTADKKDAFRPKFIVDHLTALADLDYVKRYYHWSFMDNFEWAEGLEPCFGIVEYHYKDATYTPRSSAYLYKEIIERREINDEMIERYGAK